MKKSTIWILGIVMGLSFLSLLYLQVSYIEEMVKMRREQFDESVRRSLDQACGKIERVEKPPNSPGSRLHKKERMKAKWLHTHSIMLSLRMGWTVILLSNSR